MWNKNRAKQQRIGKNINCLFVCLSVFLYLDISLFLRQYCDFLWMMNNSYCDVSRKDCTFKQDCFYLRIPHTHNTIDNAHNVCYVFVLCALCAPLFSFCLVGKTPAFRCGMFEKRWLFAYMFHFYRYGIIILVSLHNFDLFYSDRWPIHTNAHTHTQRYRNERAAARWVCILKEKGLWSTLETNTS